MSNFQPSDDTFDDVTGHKLTPRAIEEDEGTEGHRLPVRGAVTEDSDDVEGHRLPVRGAVTEDSDDVEGHRAFNLPTDADDDVEGHRRPMVK